ncbi:MAG: telomerase inhibitor [Vezdaea acicularis]|nr:MAG: telomerase inhibitor [Vezdaea acicularis]
MGLAGPRKSVKPNPERYTIALKADLSSIRRTKISHDPNNTQWTRSTTSFGHKILTSQGWTPGDILGAKKAPHASIHTPANSSHIRVVLKDDTLGLGAKRGSGLAQGECTGLDGLQDLLGRLNGKSEDVLQEERNVRTELKRNAFVQNRVGLIRFVKGGFLIGDRIQEPAISDEVVSESSNRREDSKAATHISRKKKPRKDKPVKESAKVEGDSKSIASKSGSEAALSDDMKKLKRLRKQERRLKREQEQASLMETKIKSAKKDTESQIEPAITIPPSLQPSSGRNAVRQRYIRHKRMALTDSKAMNEILMIKSS